MSNRFDTLRRCADTLAWVAAALDGEHVRFPDEIDVMDDETIRLGWRLRPAVSFSLHCGREKVVAVFSQPNEGPGWAEEISRTAMDMDGLWRVLQREGAQEHVIQKAEG